jgi:hypothetical protein
MQADAVPLPEDQAVTVADGTPDACARFAGLWEGGAWDGELAHKLLVRSVENDCTATVIYAYGSAPQWNINEPDWAAHRGKIDEDELDLEEFRNGANVSYQLISKNRLRGEYETDRGLSSVTLSRADETPK